MREVELFFDCTRPGTYIAFERLIAMQAELGFALRLRPIFIGGIFKAANPGIFAIRASIPAVKEAYIEKDFADWARFAGLRIVWPHPHHVMNSIKAMRGCVVAQRHGKLLDVARATFEACWRDGLDANDDGVLAGVCAVAGLDPVIYFAEVEEEDVKRELRDNGEELIARGGFGTPTIFVDGDDMYWGNDRLELVRTALERPAIPGAAR